MTRSLLAFIIGSSLVSGVQAQSGDPILKVYAKQYQQEKIHIHFDKDAYLPGETIWMKAYLMSGSKPSSISKNIYFDWTDIYGNLLAHTVSPIVESSSSSSFIVPAFLTGGAIHVKAYTQWMLNFDSSFLFNKDIAVLTGWDGNLRQERNSASIQFFAEGGDLINGIPSVVAFEATDQHGKPVDVKGVVKKSGEVVDSFTTMHAGMGMFTFTPKNNETYTAYWKDEFGESHSTTLPQAKPTGAVMRISPTKNNTIHFRIERATDCPDNFKSLTLIATSNQQVIYQTAIDLTGKTIMDDDISTAGMTTGILQLTLFDSRNIPFAERVTFVNSHQYSFPAQFKKDLVNLNKRGRNEISIEIPDSLSTNLSVSVTDGGLGSDTSNNIISDFLLSGDIKGNIADPSYYFSGNTENTNFYLDLVMRTHGWRRFKWDDIAAGKLPVLQYPVDSDYLALQGQINAGSSGFESNDSIALLVITKDHKRQMLSLPLSANGSFGQKGMFFYDSIQVIYKVNHAAKINSGTNIKIQSNLVHGGLTNARAYEPDFVWTKVPDVVLEKESSGSITELHNYAKSSSGLNFALTPNSKNDQTKANLETAAHYLQSNFPDLKFPIAVKDADGNSNSDNKYTSYNLNNNQASIPAQKSNVNLSLDGMMVTIDDLKQVTMKDVLFIKFLQKTGPKELPTLSISSKQSIDQNNIINNKTDVRLSCRWPSLVLWHFIATSRVQGKGS